MVKKLLINCCILALLWSCNSNQMTTESGLKYSIINKGDGPKAEDGKEIHTHCILSLEGGKEIWSTRGGETFNFVLGQTSLIPGFDETITLMQVGDRFEVTIPSELGYGERGAPPDIPPHATLIFDIEVMDVVDL